MTLHLWTFYNAEVDRRVLDRLRNAEHYSGRASRAWIVDSLASVFSPPPRPSYETTDEAVGRSLQRLRRRGLIECRSGNGVVWCLTEDRS